MKKNFFLIIGVILVAGLGFWVWRRLRAPVPPGPSQKVYVIGVVRAPPTLDLIWESFRNKIRELGYEEGKNVVYKVTEVGGDAAETKTKVAALIDQNLDVIYPLGGLAVHAAKDVTDQRHLSMPIVFGITADPVRAGLVNDLKSTGNNITGVLSANEIVSSKRL